MDKPKPNKLAQFYSGQIQPNGALSLRRSVQFWSGVDTLWRYDDNNVRPHLSRETRHPLKRGERLSNLSAPRTMRLRKTKPKNMKPKPANSRYECGGDNGADPDRNATNLDWR